MLRCKSPNSELLIEIDAIEGSPHSEEEFMPTDKTETVDGTLPEKATSEVTVVVKAHVASETTLSMTVGYSRQGEGRNRIPGIFSLFHHLFLPSGGTGGQSPKSQLQIQTEAKANDLDSEPEDNEPQDGASRSK